MDAMPLLRTCFVFLLLLECGYFIKGEMKIERERKRYDSEEEEKFHEVPDWKCYNWNAKDLALIRSLGGGKSAEREVCENVNGHVFTGGEDKLKPGCGGCWCCQKSTAVPNWKCYNWNAQDLELIKSRGGGKLAEREVCENVNSHVFTGGENTFKPGCGTCWCCQRTTVVPDWKCYNWNAKDLELIKSRGGGKQAEREVCENINGHVFTGGENTLKPGCGGCWCCQKSTAVPNWKCYNWNAKDLELIKSRGGGKPAEREVCENINGHVFTGGENTLKPGCGTCWCCQKSTAVPDWKCYNWNAKDLELIKSRGSGIPAERDVCENVNGHVFTGGENTLKPGCGGCWCCQKSTAVPDWKCYNWNAKDLELIKSRGGGKPAEREVCENINGHVFTGGENTLKPGCGGCWCCQKSTAVPDWKCYNWNGKDLELIKSGGSGIPARREVCENVNGHVFTSGENTLKPGCGTCWCCQKSTAG